MKAALQLDARGRELAWVHSGRTSFPCTFQEKGNRCQEPSEAGARRDKREERLAHYKAVPCSMLLPCCVAAAFVALYRLEVLDRAFARQSATRAA